MRSLVNRRLVSASQVTTFRECQRKWGFRAIDKLEVPSGEGAALGTKVHKVLEKYLSGEGWDFTDPEVGKIAASGIEWLPAPLQRGIELEKHFKLETPHASYQGYIDFLIAPNEGNPPIVGDHKSTSSLRWAKTAEELSVDVQANLYAHYALTRWPAENEVELQWIYYQTKGAKRSQRTHLRIVRDHIEEQIEKIDATALTIGQIVETTLPAEGNYAALLLPPSPDACEKFGGCPYRHVCNLSPAERVKAVAVGLRLHNERVTDYGLTEGVGNVADFDQIMKRLQDQKADMNGAVTHMAEEVKRVSESTFPVAAPTMPPPTALSQTSTATDYQVNPPEFQPRPTAEEEKAKTKKGAAKKKELGFILYVDCAPIGEKFTPFEKLVGEANKLIKQAKQVDDWRFVQYTAGGDLALALEDVVKTEAPEAIVVCSRTAEAQATLIRLQGMARSVVRGF